MCLVAVPGIHGPANAGWCLVDRSHSLRSLHPPLAALPSLPRWRFVCVAVREWTATKVSPGWNPASNSPPDGYESPKTLVVLRFFEPTKKSGTNAVRAVPLVHK